MLLVCYKEGGENKWDETHSLTSFKQKHPSIQDKDIIHMMNIKVSDSQAIRFAYEAGRYGLSGSDYMREFTNTRGEHCVIIGIRPRNRKYPIIVRNETKGTHNKCTSGYILECLRAETG